MRIISGKYKGRKLTPPANLPVRPTTDFAKTGLFNMLENRYEISEMDCLDLFSGTGSISLELASRGCKSITSVDKDPACVRYIKEAAAILGIENITAIKSDAIVYTRRTASQFDLIFADPPFHIPVREELHGLILSGTVLNKDGVFIMEHSSREKYDHLEGFDFSRSYGNVTFSFFLKFEPSK